MALRDKSDRKTINIKHLSITHKEDAELRNKERMEELKRHTPIIIKADEQSIRASAFQEGVLTERKRIKDYLWNKYAVNNEGCSHGRSTALRKMAKELCIMLELEQCKQPEGGIQ